MAKKKKTPVFAMEDFLLFNIGIVTMDFDEALTVCRGHCAGAKQHLALHCDALMLRSAKNRFAKTSFYSLWSLHCLYLPASLCIAIFVFLFFSALTCCLPCQLTSALSAECMKSLVLAAAAFDIAMHQTSNHHSTWHYSIIPVEKNSESICFFGISERKKISLTTLNVCI